MRNQDSRVAMEDYSWCHSYVSGQISAFSHVARCFAPFYRQRTLCPMAGKAAQDAAYADVVAAFDAYLSQWGGDRPLFVAGHSQGSYHVMRLLRDRFSGKGAAAAALRRRLVGAYAPGAPVFPRRLPHGIPLCRRPGHAGSLAIWMSVGHEGPLSDTFIGRQMRSEKAKKLPIVLNPLSWETVEDGSEGREVSGTEHRGSLGPKGTTLHRNVIDSVVVRGGLLRVREGQLGHVQHIKGLRDSSLDYHIGDVALFWGNVRQQAQEQLEAWQRGEGLERSSAPSAPAPATCAEGGEERGAEEPDDCPGVAGHAELSEVMARLGASGQEDED